MLSTGITFIIFSLTLSYFLKHGILRPIPTVRRIATSFFMVGLLNICLRVIAWIIPPFDLMATLLGTAGVLVFGIICLLEINRNYREYQNRIEKIMNGEEDE